MTDNRTPYGRAQRALAWRQTPMWCVVDVQWAHRLGTAGYHTAGDVLDASEEALARNVLGVGPVRAAKLRQTVLAYAKSHAERFGAEPEAAPGAVIEVLPPEVTRAVSTSMAEAVLGCLMLVLLGVAIWAISVVVP